jgi:tRNA(Ile2) C34 agmatinyltransferase TiaS
MRLLVCIDDTDTVDSELGTGRQSRRLADRLTGEFPALDHYGCVRQQLLVDPRVPYTTHNSCACIVFETTSPPSAAQIADVAGPYLESNTPTGSDPGLCIAPASAVGPRVVGFGRRATEEVVAESTARSLADEEGLFLEEYGGTGEGVIGALAGVGLTAVGDSGRFIAYGDIREYEGVVDVATIRTDGIAVVTGEDEPVTSGRIDTRGWVRPQLRAGSPVLPVERDGDVWVPANR